MNYAELHCKSSFSFLQGASSADQLVQRAVRLGYTALAITDRNTTTTRFSQYNIVAKIYLANIDNAIAGHI